MLHFIRILAHTTATVLLTHSLNSDAVQLPDPLQGPMKVLTIEVHTQPKHRVALRTYMQKTGLPTLERLKKEGVLGAYRVLFKRHVDHKTWDLFMLLEFPSAEAISRWRELERSMPAGLSPAALQLVTEIHTNPADRHFLGGTPAVKLKPDRPPVLMVIPYDYLTSASEYIQYVAGYVMPQTEGWIREGVLNQYQMLVGRHAVDRVWSSLLILEYKDETAFGARERTTTKVRGVLKDDPAWKAISDNKSKIREARRYIVADEMRL